jgi:RHH-type proline utilization regulon transcriptional repressor/proline dehydrogenase/delta 1-pyrroline-5-carboxylate dehydrogenase
VQIGAILASGNIALIEAANPARGSLAALPGAIAARLSIVESLDTAGDLGGVLFEGDRAALLALNRRIAAREGPIVPILARSPAAGEHYDANRLLEECAIATNTAAAGGNASLMTIG